MFKNKTLLITGGTGSFGNAVLRKFLEFDIKEIRIFSRDEKKQDDMRRKYADNRLKFYIGDVRDYESIMNAVRGVDYIFHSAALKQVPSCEFHPIEAVKTNIIGTENVLTAAINANVKRVIDLVNLTEEEQEELLNQNTEEVKVYDLKENEDTRKIHVEYI